MAALRLYNHLTMTTALPMQDDLLAHWDALLGLDWLAYVHTLDGAHAFVRALAACYTSLTTVSCFVFVALVFLGEIEEAQNFLVLFFLAAVAISTIGAFFPANGATMYYAPTKAFLHYIPADVGTWFVAPLHDVRTNPFHVFYIESMPGLTAFPSFHAAMGIIILYCSHRRPLLFGPALVFVPMMIASAVVFGGHYFVDIIAGVIFALALVYAMRLFQRSRRGIGMRHAEITAVAAE